MAPDVFYAATQTVTASSTIEGILSRALKARGVVVEQPFIPRSLKIIGEDVGDAQEPHVEVCSLSMLLECYSHMSWTF